MSQAQQTGATLDMPAREADPVSGGHPKGLAVLFTTEMWERFNFYGMRAILTLFMANALLMNEGDASLIYGGFLALCYLTPMLGGYISDKFLGNRNCIILGGTAMGVGQLLLFGSASVFATDIHLAKTMMWCAMLVIIFGNGFFKPNISSMVGQLYPPQQKSKLDSAFTIFYMGINIGALLGQTICPLVGDKKTMQVVNGVETMVRNTGAFKWGFLAAAIAMFVGSIVFTLLKNKYIVTPEGKPIGTKPDKNAVLEGEATSAKFTTGSVVILLCMVVGLYFVFQYFAWDPIKMPMKGSGIGAYFEALAISPIKTFLYPFIYASGISLAVFILSDKTLTKIETQRILVLYIASFFVIFFWAAFEQAGSSLTFIADHQTDTNLLGMTLPPSMVQNFNGFFVIIFAFPFSMMWSAMAKKNMEPISPVKQAIGLMLIGLGYLMIAGQVKNLGSAGKIGIIWMILLYLIHTWGELCLSPIGLSLVAKLAPRRFASLLMGVFFLSNASGYALAGTLGALLPPTGDKFENAQKLGIDLKGVLDGTMQATPQQLTQLKDANLPTSYPVFAGFTIHNLYEFFMVFVTLCCVASVILLLISPKLKKMMHGVR